MNIPRDLQNKAIILGVKIDDQPLDYFFQKTKAALNSNSLCTVFTPNPEICLKATQIKDYKDVLNSATLNLPDGFGLKLGAKILGIELKNRVTGADFTKKLLDENTTTNVFVLLRNDSLTRPEDLKLFFNKTYPQIKLDFTLTQKNDNDSRAVIEQIKKHQTQILFVCLGAPEQEQWIEKNSEHLTGVKIALAVGGSFDFLCKKIKRAPNWMQNFGIEWLYRLYQEPKRLGRIKHATADFLLECHKWAKRRKSEYRANVLGVIKNKEGLFLIQKSVHLDNHWQFPQGGVDENEAAEVAVLREINEELAFNINELKIEKQLNAENTYVSPYHYQLLHGYKGQKQIAFLVFYSGNIKPEQFIPNREVAAIKWVEKRELIKLLHPVRQEFYKKFIDQI